MVTSSRLRSAGIFALVLLLFGALMWAGTGALPAAPADAQSLPNHLWSYPYCGPQPYILAIFDHSYAHVERFTPVEPDIQTVYTGGQRPGCGGQIEQNYTDPETGEPCWRYSGHNGWDYNMVGANGGLATGYAPVYAVEDGTVQYAGYEAPLDDYPWGMIMRVAHGGSPDFDSEYLHLSATLYETGDTVERGRVIGVTGLTGNTGYPHLHFMAKEHRDNAEGDVWADLFPYFDAYGWDQDWQNLDSATPTIPDPWPSVFDGDGINPPADPPGPAAVSEGRRLMLPGSPDNDNVCVEPCPGEIVIDDSDPEPEFTIVDGSWDLENGVGTEGEYIHAAPSGTAGTVTAEVMWDFGAVDSNTVFKVEAFLPESDFNVGTHAARYLFPDGSETVLSQFMDGLYGVRGQWITIAYKKFPGGNADIHLTNDASIGDNVIGTFVEGSGDGRVVIADAMRITPLCGLEEEPGVRTPTPGITRTPTATNTATPSTSITTPTATPTRTSTPSTGPGGGGPG